MAQIEQDAVKQALAEAGGTSVEGSLRPDEIDRIKAAFAEPDVEARVAKVSALLNELEAAAAGNEQRLLQIQRQFGLEPGMTSQFLKSDRVDPAGQREIDQAIEASVSQLVEDARREARQAVSGPKSARPPRSGRISI